MNWTEWPFMSFTQNHYFRLMASTSSVGAVSAGGGNEGRALLCVRESGMKILPVFNS